MVIDQKFALVETATDKIKSTSEAYGVGPMTDKRGAWIDAKNCSNIFGSSEERGLLSQERGLVPKTAPIFLAQQWVIIVYLQLMSFLLSFFFVFSFSLFLFHLFVVIFLFYILISTTT